MANKDAVKQCGFKGKDKRTALDPSIRFVAVPSQVGDSGGPAVYTDAAGRHLAAGIVTDNIGGCTMTSFLAAQPVQTALGVQILTSAG